MSWVIQYFCTSCNLSFFIQPIEIADLEKYVIICLLFPANIENNRHKWKFFEKEKVQYLLIGQKANYLLNKQSRAKIWYTHLHIWRNFRSTKHWMCFSIIKCKHFGLTLYCIWPRIRPSYLNCSVGFTIHLTITY